ncbi:MAG: DUF5050 domain-containing protein [Bacillota bacterium]|nr:DUF5050 domain-containing protein [Bacillota bacterium]
MDDKDLNLENQGPDENPVPEDTKKDENEVSEENSNSDMPESEVSEVKEAAVPDEKEGEDDFATVNLGVEDQNYQLVPKKKKKNKAMVVVSIALAVLLVAAAMLLCKMFFFSSASEGTGNLYSRGIATTKGNDVYYVNFSDYKMYKANIKTGESKCLSDDFAMYISNYKNKIYYLGVKINDQKTAYTYQFKKYVDGKNDVVILDSEISQPQFSGNYLYYMVSVPEINSGYSSYIYRVSLKGGKPELVCDVPCVSFYVDKNDLYYCDVSLSSLVKVDLLKSIKLCTAPLKGKTLRASSDLSAEVIAKTIATCMVRYKDSIYYIDNQNNNQLLRYDMGKKKSYAINDGTYVAAINIYNNYMYYYNAKDYSIYRMKMDGSDVRKITGAGYGFMALSNNKFLYMNFTESYQQYIAVCDLDGKLIKNVGLDQAAAGSTKGNTANSNTTSGDTTTDKNAAKDKASEGATQKQETTSKETASAKAQ